MAKISKKQRVALKEIDKLAQERKRDRILGFASIGVMVVFIVLYNQLTYNYGVITEDNAFIRGVLYVIAMVIAGFCGIKLMRASQKQRKIDGYRQANGISRETLDAWQRGEIE